MLRCLRRMLLASLCTLLVIAGQEASVAAITPQRVTGVDVAGQHWYSSKLRVRWDAVSGATYQVRWASTEDGLRASTPMATSRAATYLGPLNRGGTTYVQVRAVRNETRGAWSRVRGFRFRNKWPSQPVLSGRGLAGAARFTWSYTAYASRYRVRWAAAPHGKWPNTTQYITSWLPQTARSSTFTVPSIPKAGDHMLGVAYANPVWGRVEANNQYLDGATRLSAGWVPVFPAAPDPGTGDPVRVGTYNVWLFPSSGQRVKAIAANISGHGLDVVALQEANTATAKAVVGALGSGWAHVPTGTGVQQQIVYRTSKYRLEASGIFDVPDAKSPSTPLLTPWARLAPLTYGSGHRSVYVVSVHFSEDPDETQMEKKRDAGLMAQAVLAAVDGFNTVGDPVIVAGDQRYLREPFNDVPGYVEGPPTFVRAGYYDAMAAVRKTGIAYTTVNAINRVPSAQQTPRASGVATRSDYIMVKGFRGSNAYVNVANWSYGELVPSDHNLVYADLTVPLEQ
jgi:endonuclease/exonuclease/phosphatase family metal-dependent hydrolase